MRLAITLSILIALTQAQSSSSRSSKSTIAPSSSRSSRSTTTSSTTISSTTISSTSTSPKTSTTTSQSSSSARASTTSSLISETSATFVDRFSNSNSSTRSTLTTISTTSSSSSITSLSSLPTTPTQTGTETTASSGYNYASTAALDYTRVGTVTGTTLVTADSSVQSISVISASAALADPPLGATDAITEQPFAYEANCTAGCTAAQIDFSADSAFAKPTVGCGIVSNYFGQTRADWDKHNMDQWLGKWIEKNRNQIVLHSKGFAGAFGQWATGAPDFSCQDDGSRTNCDFDPCTILASNDRNNETRQAYYVMESINRLHSYFTGLSESFTTASVGTALAQSGFSQTFYTDNKKVDLTVTRELMGMAGMTCGLIACAAGFAPIGIALGVAAVMTVFGGAIGAIGPVLPITGDDGPLNAAAMGSQIARLVAQGISQFSSANNVIVSGRNYLRTGDIRSYLRNGSFLAFPGIDKNLVTNQASAYLLGQSINALWRIQNVYIMGGGACGDNQGIGDGPQEAVVCRDGKAWYLYSWHKPSGGFSFNLEGKYGWIEAPPGMDKLGKGIYAGVSVKDVINSSLDAYIAAGYNYTSSTAIARAREAMTKNFVNPLQQGPGFEGVFTIPVCDVGYMVNQDLYRKEYLLQPYGGDRRPFWCGPICGNASLPLTLAFIAAANLNDFNGPYWNCDSYPWRHKYASRYYGKYPSL